MYFEQKIGYSGIPRNSIHENDVLPPVISERAIEIDQTIDDALNFDEDTFHSYFERQM